MNKKVNECGIVVGRNESHFFVFTPLGTALLDKYARSLSGVQANVADFLRVQIRPFHPPTGGSCSFVVEEYKIVSNPSDMKAKQEYKNVSIICKLKYISKCPLLRFHKYSHYFLKDVYDVDLCIKDQSFDHEYTAVVRPIHFGGRSRFVIRRILPDDYDLRHNEISLDTTGICCRDFGTLVVYTPIGVAVLLQSFRPLRGKRAHLGMWIRCKLRRCDFPVRASNEYYRFMVTEYEETFPCENMKCTSSFSASSIQLDCLVRVGFRNQRPVLQNNFIADILDDHCLIQDNGTSDEWHVLISNYSTPVDEYGCMDLRWTIEEILDHDTSCLTKVYEIPPTSHGNTKDSVFTHSGRNSEASHLDPILRDHSHNTSTAFPNILRELSNSSDSTMYSAKSLIVEEVCESDRDSPLYVPAPRKRNMNGVEASSHNASSSQSWEELLRRMMSNTTIRSTIRTKNIELFDDIITRLL